MGSKFKPSSQQYRKQVSVMLTDSQYAKLCELAKQEYDRSLSSFLRQHLRVTLFKEVTPK